MQCGECGCILSAGVSAISWLREDMHMATLLTIVQDTGVCSVVERWCLLGSPLSWLLDSMHHTALHGMTPVQAWCQFATNYAFTLEYYNSGWKTIRRSSPPGIHIHQKKKKKKGLPRVTGITKQ